MAQYKQSAATVQVKPSMGKLYGIAVSASSSGTLAVYDSDKSSASDPKISDVIAVTAGTTYLAFPAGIFFNNGLYVVLGGTSAAFTVVYE